MNRYDWRNKDENWQKRAFILSSFVRMKSEITSHIYEFCDYLISQGYKFPLSGLDEVDEYIRNLYKEYAQHTNWDDRI